MLNVAIKYEGKIHGGDMPTDYTLQEFLNALQGCYPNFEIVDIVDSELSRDVWPELQLTTKMPKKIPSPLLKTGTNFKFRLGGGKMKYNFASKRLEVLEEDGNTISLHCGDLIDIYLNGKWETHRVEMHESWYIVNLFD